MQEIISWYMEHKTYGNILIIGIIQTVDKGLREIMFLGAFFSPLRRCFV